MQEKHSRSVALREVSSEAAWDLRRVAAGTAYVRDVIHPLNG